MVSIVLMSCNCIVDNKISASKQTNATLLAYQHQMVSPLHSTMIQQQTQQAQMGALQPQVQLPQQQVDNVVCRSSVITSTTSPAISSVNIVSTTSQSLVPICSLTLQSTTLPTPVTTCVVQYDNHNEQQKLLCSSTTNTISSSSSLSSSSSSSSITTEVATYMSAVLCIECTML